MNHPAELAIHEFLQKVSLGKAKMNKATLHRIAKDVEDALSRQFSGDKRQFKLRMSNLGRKKCQLWFEKNHPEKKQPDSPYFLINMILGDIVEAVFKGLLRASKVKFEDSKKVVLKTKKKDIEGSYDLVLNDRVDDVKSTSPWSYENKFVDFNTLKSKDSFGYVAQLAGYAKARGVKAGGWWAVNKANGNFKYVDADDLNMDEELKKIDETIAYIEDDAPFERCYEPIEETYYGKSSGNLKLGIECSLCSFKDACWSDLQVLPSRVSRSANPPLINYVKVEDGKTKVKEQVRV